MMLSIINLVEFKHIIWIIPVTLLVHELEEWNIVNWHKKNFTNGLEETYLSTRMWELFLSLVGFAWTAIAFFIPNNTVASIWLLVLVDFTLLNGLQHLYLLFHLKRYNPGLFFSNVFGIPAAVYIACRILVEGFLPFWALIIFALLIVPGLVSTVNSRDKMPKMIYIVNNIGIKLANWISN